MRMHHELLHNALQEEEARAVVIEIDPEAREEEGENYAAGYKDDYDQGNSEEDQEEEPERDTQFPTNTKDGAPQTLPAKGDTGGGWRPHDNTHVV
jgi:hypothetical protein